jgi:hypothetical protein
VFGADANRPLIDAPEFTKARTNQHNLYLEPSPKNQPYSSHGDVLAVVPEGRMFKTNRIIGWLILAAVVYCVLQAYGLLPDGAPRLFPQRSGGPSA